MLQTRRVEGTAEEETADGKGSEGVGGMDMVGDRNDGSGYR